MNMQDAFEDLITSFDPEAVWIGEHLKSNREFYLSEVEKAGYSREKAEQGMTLFCRKTLMAVGEDGEPFPFPDYREDVVAELKNLAGAEYKEAC